jgi:hypothetical protein
MAIITKKRVGSGRSSTLRSAVFVPVVLVLFMFGGWVAWLSTSSGDGYTSEYDTSQLGKPAGSSQTTNGTRNWIWDQLTPTEKLVALHDARQYLEAFVNVLNQTEQDKWISHHRCDVELFGSQWGTHQLCKRQDVAREQHPNDACAFLSFGISVDYSFDTDLAERWKCQGFAADPTIVHKSQLHDLVTFHNIAAKTLRDNQEKRVAKRPWWIASVPAVKRFLGIKHIDVLKMDCEGCGKFKVVELLQITLSL